MRTFPSSSKERVGTPPMVSTWWPTWGKEMTTHKRSQSWKEAEHAAEICPPGLSGHGGETYGAFPPTRPLASAFMLRHPIALEGVLGGEVVGESWGG